MKFEDEQGREEIITATVEHPFWVQGQGWVGASDLVPEDQIFTSHNQWLTLISATLTPELETVYNFEVDQIHNYFVGQSGAWVHNMSEAIKFTSAMKSGAKRIASGRNIRKIQVLVEKFGGKANGWRKMKTWDHLGREIHYYEHHGIGRVGMKFKGQMDPF